MALEENLHDKLRFDPAALDSSVVYKIMSGVIVPRPIAFVTTLSPDGVANAAPFSFFNMISHKPPLLCISFSYDDRKDQPKDTLRNIEATKEFVVNSVRRDIAAAMDLCSEYYPSDVDEIAMSGLTPVPSVQVKPPRLLESFVNFECRCVQIVGLPGGSTNRLIIGEIVMMHVQKGLLDENNRVDQRALDAIGRIGGNVYCDTSTAFTIGEA